MKRQHIKPARQMIYRFGVQKFVFVVLESGLWKKKPCKSCSNFTGHKCITCEAPICGRMGCSEEIHDGDLKCIPCITEALQNSGAFDDNDY